MPKKTDSKNLSLIVQLANKLNVNLKDSKNAIAPENDVASLKSHDNRLTAKLNNIVSHPILLVESSVENAGIYIELARDVPCAPLGAVYCITSFRRESENEITSLNKDIYRVYVGKEGIILDEAALMRASNIYNKKG